VNSYLKTPRGVLRPVKFRTVIELPPPDIKRWVARRKADVVLAIRHGLITAEQACRRYNLTLDELASWQTAYQKRGVNGLQTTKNRRNKTA